MVIKQKNITNHWDTIVIGGGQAGLAVGYYLKKQGAKFLIIESGSKIGDSWRNRWDSLCLFTPARYDGLPGTPFPASGDAFPSKDEVADYLGNYVKRYDLPVLTGVTVKHLLAEPGGCVITTSSEIFTSDKVVIATGTNPTPKIPDFSSKLDKKIFQIHSSQYRNPGSIPPGDVLVVGAGTSGVEISIELRQSRRTMISGKPTFHIPDPVFKYAGGLYWWFVNNVLTVQTPIGKKAKKSIIHGGAPLIRISANDLETAGVERVPRVTGTESGYPKLEDGRILQVSAIVWATGYKPDFSWIEPVISDVTGWPKAYRGVSSSVEGIYFVGMPFQFGLTSGLIGGVGRDAAYITKQISMARP
jgi:putative flavoprotein involved in K+ transport